MSFLIVLEAGVQDQGAGWPVCVLYGQPSYCIRVPLMTSFWRRKWPPTPVFLPGKSHGLRILVGYSPWGRKVSETTERLHFTMTSLNFTSLQALSPSTVALGICSLIYEFRGHNLVHNNL